MPSTREQEIIQALLHLGAATIYEAQGARNALDHGIKPIDPRMRMAGPAFTIDMRPADNLMIHYALLKIRPGQVLVVDAKAFLEAGPWGDVLTQQALHIGLAGLLINGSVRDAQAITNMGFPVFSRGVSIKSTGKNQPGKIEVPVVIGDVRITPGDYVLGDRDGVVIVEADQVDAVIQAARVRQEKEESFRREIQAGATTAGLLGLQDTLKRFDLI